MQIYYRNLNANCDGDGVTGSCAELTVIRENYPNYRCLVDFGMVQNSKMKSEQLHKINGRELPLGGDFGNGISISDVWISHSH